jgi:hypothetical protein
MIPFHHELPGLILVVAMIGVADHDLLIQPLDRVLKLNSLKFLGFIK